MKKHFSRWQEAFLIAGGSLLVALIAAQLQTPYFLKASLLSFKGWRVAEENNSSNHCWKRDNGELLYDNRLSAEDGGWMEVGDSYCSSNGLNKTGQRKGADGRIYNWGEWSSSGSGSWSGSGSGSGSSSGNGSSSDGRDACADRGGWMEPYSGNDMAVCYRRNSTGEVKKLLGRNVPAGNRGWVPDCIRACDGLQLSDSVDAVSSDSDSDSGSDSGNGSSSDTDTGTSTGSGTGTTDRLHGASEGDENRKKVDDNRDNEQDKRNAERQYKDLQRNLSERQRELKNNFRNSNVDLTEANDLLSQWEGKLNELENLLDQESMEVFWSLNKDLGDFIFQVNDTFQALYGKQRYSNLDRQFVEREKEFSRMEKDMTRSTGNSKEGKEELTNLLNNLKADLAALKQKYQGIPADDEDQIMDLEYELNSFGDRVRDFYDKMQEVNQKADLGNQQKDAERVLKDKKRSMKDHARTIKDQKRMKSDVAEMEKILEELNVILSKMETMQKASDFDPQAFWDLNQEFDDLDRGFWDSVQESGEAERVEQEGKDMERWTRDTERELKDRGRFIEQMRKDAKRGELDSDAVEKIAGIFEEMKKKVKEAKVALASKDFDKARDLMEVDLNDLRQEFEEASQSLQGSRELQFAKKEFERATHGIKRAQDKLNRLVKSRRMDESRAQVCQEYIDEGASLLKEAIAQVDKGDAEALKDLEERANALGENSQRDCGELDDERPDFEGFNEVYVDQPNRRMSKDILDRISADVAERVLEHLGRNSMIFNDILKKKLGERFKDEIAKTLEATSSVDDTAVSEDILNQKAAILEQIQEMEELTTRLEGLRKLAHSQLEELRALQDEIASYNFIGDSGSDIQDEIERFMAEAAEGKGDVNADDIKALREEAKRAIEKAREEKFKKGVIAFKDADDNVWFGVYAKMAKAKGWVKGTGESGYTRVNPEAPTNVAEAVTMLGRVTGAADDPSAEPDSVLGKRLPEWARAGAVALEKAGVNLDVIFGRKKAGDIVSRVEVARMLQILLKLAPGDASSFEDINEAASGEERDAIGAVKTAGIMTGQGDGSRFDPKGPLNRAALMKILTEAAAEPVRE